MSTMVISPVRTFDKRLADRTADERPADRPVAASPAPRDAGNVRLTRRGQLTVLLATLATVLVVGFFLGAGSVATLERGQSAPTEIVQVAPGETLWDIASRLTPTGEDVRDTMYDIKRLNALESSALGAGQRIRVPTSS